MEHKSKYKCGSEAKNVAVSLRGLLSQKKQVFEAENYLHEMEKRMNKAVANEVKESISKKKKM